MHTVQVKKRGENMEDRIEICEKLNHRYAFSWQADIRWRGACPLCPSGMWGFSKGSLSPAVCGKINLKEALCLPLT